MAVLAHPDDESLGIGGTLARNAAEGTDIFLITATRGGSGAHRGIRRDDPGHPGSSKLAELRDHIAISQFATAAAVAAADAALASTPDAGPAHAVSKLYYLAWPESTWTAYQSVVGTLRSRVDDVQRQATPWPDWALTTVIDTRQFWPTVWRAVSCHESQIAAFGRLKDLSPEEHAALWGSQSFYRAFSLVNGGRTRETDLFEGISR
jgi:LmbE family N-acetylglucosaminyl deacetylase